MPISTTSKVFYLKGIFFLPNWYICVSNMLSVGEDVMKSQLERVVVTCIICRDAKHATCLQLSTAKIYFLFP